MKSLRFLDRRAGYSLASLGILLGVVAPAALPAFTSADVLTSRSVTMSSSVAAATGVSYTTQFTLAKNIPVGGGVVVQFCDSSSGPLIGTDCDEPAGMDLSGATFVSADIDPNTGTFSPAADNGTLTKANETSAGANDNYIKWVSGTGDTLNANYKLKLAVSGIDNPSATGTFYARIYTYAATPDFTDSVATGTVTDSGAVALSATSQIGVHAYVLESMTFCVSKGDIVGDTANAGTTTYSAQGAPSSDCGGTETSCAPVGNVVPDGCVVAPDMTIGKQGASASIMALDSSVISTGGVYAQLSTNASGGAVVNLKSDATSCGGLYRNGDPANCDITPQTATGSFTAGSAKFGLKVGTPAIAPDKDGAVGTGSGTGSISNGTNYGSDFFMDYTAGNTQGVTSTYGSKVFAASGPVNNVNVPLTFGASISNTTPAGVYGANLNMIATGTF